MGRSMAVGAFGGTLSKSPIDDLPTKIGSAYTYRDLDFISQTFT
jgi:hypothetical protein